MSINVNSNIISSTGFDLSGNTLNSQNIVTDGLLLWYDAGNLSSYNNSANYYDCGYGCQYYASSPGCTNCNTQIKDMSGLGYDGTLAGGTTVLYSNIGGYLNFDASSELVTTSLSTFGNNTTWSAWIYCTAEVTGYNMFMGRILPYFGFYNGNSFIFSNYINSTQQTFYASGSYSLNTWYNVVFTTEYTGGNTISTIYVNGLYDNSATFSGSQTQQASTFTIGDGQPTYWYRFNGYVPIVMIHNKTLSTVEVLQNFNTDRQRFGI